MVNVNYEGLRLKIKTNDNIIELEVTNSDGIHLCLVEINCNNGLIVYNEYNNTGDRIVYVETSDGEKIRWEYDNEGNLLSNSLDGIIVE
jgi:YD repeat-containing protein